MNINLKLDKKKIIIIGSVVLAIILITLSVYLYKKNQSRLAIEDGAKTVVFIPEFLSSEEKTKLEIPVETKIQAVKRDADGEIKVYRIIKSDADIVDPAKVEPISPRTVN